MGWKKQRTAALFSSRPELRVVKQCHHQQLLATAISPSNSFCDIVTSWLTAVCKLVLLHP